MIVFKILLINLFISLYQCRLPDKVYCANQECSQPISKAKTLLSYNSVDPDLISFRANSDAIIYMKSAGTHTDLWYAEINGVAGFVNTKFLREYKILEKKPTFVIPYEGKYEKVQPNKVQQAHEVFEGTTIFTTEATIPPTQDTSTLAPTSDSVQSPSPLLTEIPKISTQNWSDNNYQNSNNLNSNEILIEQNNNDLPAPTYSEEPHIISQEETVNSNIETDISILSSSTTESPVQHFENSALNEKQNIVETNSELPEAISSESIPLPQPLIATNNENMVSSENPVDVPDKVDYLQQSIINPDVTDSNELNVSAPSNQNNNVENNVPPIVETNSGENILSQEYYVAPQPNNNNMDIPQVPEPSVPIQNNNDLVNNVNYVDSNNLQNSNGMPISDQNLNKQVYETVDSTENVLIDNSQTPPPFTETTYFPTSTENIPSNLGVAESAETFTEPPASQEEITKWLPQTQAHESIAPDTNIEVPQPVSHENTESDSTTESYIYASTESTGGEANEFHSTSEETTGTENYKDSSILSDIYSTLSDIWPSSTENPSPDTIFNTDYMHDQSSIDAASNEPIDASSNEGFSIVSYIIATYKSIMGSREESRALFATPGETCSTDEYCDGENTENKNRLLTFLVTTASSVLLFTLGYYYIDNRRQDSRLIGTINILQRDLLFSTKECEILKEELSSTKTKLAGIEDSSFGMDDMVLSLKEEIKELKAQNERLLNSLDDNEKLLRVSENTASELQNTLGDVENTLSELLAERANTEEQIAELNGKVQAFEEELISVSRERDNFQLKYVSAESALEETKKQKKLLEELNLKLNEAHNTIELQKHEVVALKDVVKELKSGVSSNVDATSLIDHTEIKAKLSKESEEKETFMSKYELERNERVRLTQELAVTQESLQTSTQQAAEALTRLEVLGKYFQQRESELMKELSAKESLWLSKQGESASTVEKMEVLQQEAQRYKGEVFMGNKRTRLRSPYILWLNSAREQLKAENPGLTVTEIAKQGAEIWRSMKDKSYWEEMAKRAQEQYEKDLKLYYANESKSDNDGQIACVLEKDELSIREEVFMGNERTRVWSAYMLWLNSSREQIKVENPGLTVTKITKKGAEIWRSMEDKSYWEDMAKRAQGQYEKDLKLYYANESKGDGDGQIACAPEEDELSIRGVIFMGNKWKLGRSPYVLWLNSAREQLKAENPGLTVTEIAKKGAEIWRSRKDKSYWEEMAKRVQEQYEKNLK